MTHIVEKIVALAQLRWLQAETVQVVITGRPNGPSPGEGNLPKWGEWEAQIRLGGGQWGELAGVGKCPDLALNALLSNLLTAHKAVDERRAAVLVDVAKGHLPKGEDSEQMDRVQFNAVPAKTLDQLRVEMAATQVDRLVKELRKFYAVEFVGDAVRAIRSTGEWMSLTRDFIESATLEECMARVHVYFANAKQTR